MALDVAVVVNWTVCSHMFVGGNVERWRFVGVRKTILYVV